MGTFLKWQVAQRAIKCHLTTAKSKQDPTFDVTGRILTALAHVKIRMKASISPTSSLDMSSCLPEEY